MQALPSGKKKEFLSNQSPLPPPPSAVHQSLSRVESLWQGSEVWGGEGLGRQAKQIWARVQRKTLKNGSLSSIAHSV